MSFTTLLGVIFGFGLFIFSIVISTENYLIFLSFPSALMVVGGTLAATFIGQEARYVWLALRGIVRIFMVQRVGRNVLNREVGRIIRWGYLVQSGGYWRSKTKRRKFTVTNFCISASN